MALNVAEEYKSKKLYVLTFGKFNRGEKKRMKSIIEMAILEDSDERVESLLEFFSNNMKNGWEPLGYGSYAKAIKNKKVRKPEEV